MRSDRQSKIFGNERALTVAVARLPHCELTAPQHQAHRCVLLLSLHSASAARTAPLAPQAAATDAQICHRSLASYSSASFQLTSLLSLPLKAPSYGTYDEQRNRRRGWRWCCFSVRRGQSQIAHAAGDPSDARDWRVARNSSCPCCLRCPAQRQVGGGGPSDGGATEATEGGNDDREAEA